MLLKTVPTLLAVLALWSIARPALAEKSAPVCIPHHEKAQELRIGGKLVQAKQELLACASDRSCPSVIQDECDRMLESLGHDIPSVVFAARDQKGDDTVDVEVYSGQELILKKLQVQGYELDPGKYQFRFVAADGASKLQTVVVRQGEQARRIVVDFQRAAAPTPVSPATPDAAPRENGGAWKRPVGYVLVGLGAVGIGVGSYFGLRAKSKNDDSRQYCDATDHCQPPGIALVDQAKTAANISTISFAVGIASAAAGTILVLTAPSSEPERAGQSAPWRGGRAGTAMRFAPAVGPGFAGAAVSGVFTW